MWTKMQLPEKKSRLFSDCRDFGPVRMARWHGLPAREVRVARSGTGDSPVELFGIEWHGRLAHVLGRRIGLCERITGESPVPHDPHGRVAHATQSHGRVARATFQSHGRVARATRANRAVTIFFAVGLPARPRARRLRRDRAGSARHRRHHHRRHRSCCWCFHRRRLSGLCRWR